MINPSQVSENDIYYNRDRPSLRAMIRSGPNSVIDVGCGSGAFGKTLLETGMAKEVIGIELFAEAAQAAAEHYSHVHIGDIEVLDLPYENRFDYAVCGDVLEHLKDPYSVLKRLSGCLNNSGVLICSVPNIRHWSTIWKLLFRGSWEYADAGIMDRTHLRFFTRRSILEAVRNAGFDVERYSFLLGGKRWRILNFLTFGLLVEFWSTQIVVRAEKGSGT